MPTRPHLVGYPDRLTARPGERLSLQATADRRRRAEAALVRLGSAAGARQGGSGGGERTAGGGGDPAGGGGDPAGGGPPGGGPATPGVPVREAVVQSLGEVEIAPQDTQCGSFMVAGGGRDLCPGSFSAAVLVSPSRLGRPQCLLGQFTSGATWWLGIEAGGRPVARASAGSAVCEAVAESALAEGAWYLVAAGFDPAAGIRLAVRPLPFTASWRVALDASIADDDATAAAGPAAAAVDGLLDAPFVVAARAIPGEWAPTSYEDCFDGRIERPLVVSGTLDEGLVERLQRDEAPADRLVVAWDFAARLGLAGARGTRVPSTGAPGCDGTLWNSPFEAATGHRWSGREQDFRLAPGEYAAVHFHADDLDDCRWAPTVEVDLPEDLPSGVYALRLADGGLVDRAPFFVRPVEPSTPLLFLAPTASYLAYANDHPASDGDFSEATASRTPVVFDDDLLLHEHREWGLSCYDAHLDGSGVGISSARRPLVNLRPSHRYHVGPWQLPADLALLEWLADEGIAHDVATDEDLHREGVALLAPYRAVLSGTHPEYYSTAMLDGLETYLADGGRLAHLGANGYYWRVAFDPERPWVMELRRGNAGSRAWESAPGEVHLAFSGERGGLWRHLGRPPQRLTGVGYAAQGFDRCGWYRRQADSYDPRVAFLFDGVSGDVFGTQGNIGGGAVGQELDRYDGALGTPRDALLLATSEGLTEGYQRCVEEVLFTVPGTNARLDPDVRADVVYHVKPGGGAVFATGSIAWAGALACDPAIARITRNLLTRFCDPEPLPW